VRSSTPRPTRGLSPSFARPPFAPRSDESHLVVEKDRAARLRFARHTGWLWLLAEVLATLMIVASSMTIRSAPASSRAFSYGVIGDQTACGMESSTRRISPTRQAMQAEPGIFTGGGKVPSLTRRQIVVREYGSSFRKIDKRTKAESGGSSNSRRTEAVVPKSEDFITCDDRTSNSVAFGIRGAPKRKTPPGTPGGVGWFGRVERCGQWIPKRATKNPAWATRRGLLVRAGRDRCGQWQ
jgi:hypothetical protein